MKNIRLTVEYDGTNYNGWQIQDSEQRKKSGKVKTIQGTLEGALFNILSTKVRLISSSRTDSGVHALGHVANFKSSTKLTPTQIKNALNSVIPDDIVIKEAEEVGINFNAQYDAIDKAYRYLICNQNCISPFIRKYAYHFRQPLDVSLMRKEASTIVGKHDFRGFSNGAKRENSVRTVKRLDVSKKGNIIKIEIEADGFLYNMARNIVGTLIEVGRGRFQPGTVKSILKKKDRSLAGPTVPAKGLCLAEVKYR